MKETSAGGKAQGTTVWSPKAPLLSDQGFCRSNRAIWEERHQIAYSMTWEWPVQKNEEPETVAKLTLNATFAAPLNNLADSTLAKNPCGYKKARSVLSTRMSSAENFTNLIHSPILRSQGDMPHRAQSRNKPDYPTTPEFSDDLAWWARKLRRRQITKCKSFEFSWAVLTTGRHSLGRNVPRA
jgi:hypothetical protein